MPSEHPLSALSLCFCAQLIKACVDNTIAYVTSPSITCFMHSLLPLLRDLLTPGVTSLTLIHNLLAAAALLPGVVPEGP